MLKAVARPKKKVPVKRSPKDNAWFSSGVNRETLDENLQQISKGLHISETQSEMAMREYTHTDGTHPQMETNMRGEQGNIQLGFSKKSKELVMALEKKANPYQNAAYEDERKILDQTPERRWAKPPRLVTQGADNDSAIGLRYNGLARPEILQGLMRKAGRRNTTASAMLSFMESGWEKRLHTGLRNHKRRLNERRSANGDKSVNRQQTAEDKKMDKITTIIGRKQQRTLYFNAATRRAQTAIKEKLTHMADDSLELLLKKKARRQAAESGILPEFEQKPDSETSVGRVPPQTHDNRLGFASESERNPTS